MKRSFHHGDLRNALIKVSKHLVERKGVEAFSLREAARKVGVSANAAYNFFKDRDDLLGAVATDGFAELAVLREEARAKVGSDPWTRLSAGGKEYVRFAEERPRLFDLMFGPLGIGSERYKAQAPAPSDRKPYQQLTEVLDKLVLDGRITPQRRAGAESVLWPMIHGLAVLRRVGALPESLNVSWKRMQKFTADALGLDLDE